MTMFFEILLGFVALFGIGIITDKIKPTTRLFGEKCYNGWTGENSNYPYIPRYTKVPNKITINTGTPIGLDASHTIQICGDGLKHLSLKDGEFYTWQNIKGAKNIYRLKQNYPISNDHPWVFIFDTDECDCLIVRKITGYTSKTIKGSYITDGGKEVINHFKPSQIIGMIIFYTTDETDRTT